MKAATASTRTTRTTETERFMPIPEKGFIVGPRVPQNLAAAVEGLAREILRQQPDDIYRFAAQHFEKLVESREEEERKNGDTRPSSIDETITKASRRLRKLQGTTRTLRGSGWSLTETARILTKCEKARSPAGSKGDGREIGGCCEREYPEPAKSQRQTEDSESTIVGDETGLPPPPPPPPLSGRRSGSNASNESTGSTGISRVTRSMGTIEFTGAAGANPKRAEASNVQKEDGRRGRESVDSLHSSARDEEEGEEYNLNSRGLYATIEDTWTFFPVVGPFSRKQSRIRSRNSSWNGSNVSNESKISNDVVCFTEPPEPSAIVLPPIFADASKPLERRHSFTLPVLPMATENKGSRQSETKSNSCQTSFSDPRDRRIEGDERSSARAESLVRPKSSEAPNSETTASNNFFSQLAVLRSKWPESEKGKRVLELGKTRSMVSECYKKINTNEEKKNAMNREKEEEGEEEEEQEEKQEGEHDKNKEKENEKVEMEIDMEIEIDSTSSANSSRRRSVTPSIERIEMTRLYSLTELNVEESFKDSLNVTPDSAELSQRPDSLEPREDENAFADDYEREEGKKAGNDEEEQELEGPVSNELKSKLIEIESFEKSIERVLDCTEEGPANAISALRGNKGKELEISQYSENIEQGNDVVDKNETSRRENLSSVQGKSAGRFNRSNECDPLSYVLTEGSPCDIPESVITLVMPEMALTTDSFITKDASRCFNGDDDDDDEDNDARRIGNATATALGEYVPPMVLDRSTIDDVDLPQGIKDTLESTMPRRDLGKIKEEECEEEDEETEVRGGTCREYAGRTEMQEAKEETVKAENVEAKEKDEKEEKADLRIFSSEYPKLHYLAKSEELSGPIDESHDFHARNPKVALEKEEKYQALESNKVALRCNYSDDGDACTELGSSALKAIGFDDGKSVSGVQRKNKVEDKREGDNENIEFDGALEAVGSAESSNETNEATTSDRSNDALSLDKSKPFVPELNLDSLRDVTVSSFGTSDLENLDNLDNWEKLEGQTETRNGDLSFHVSDGTSSSLIETLPASDKKRINSGPVTQLSASTYEEETSEASNRQQREESSRKLDETKDATVVREFGDGEITPMFPLSSGDGAKRVDSFDVEEEIAKVLMENAALEVSSRLDEIEKESGDKSGWPPSPATRSKIKGDRLQLHREVQEVAATFSKAESMYEKGKESPNAPDNETKSVESPSPKDEEDGKGDERASVFPDGLLFYEGEGSVDPPLSSTTRAVMTTDDGDPEVRPEGDTEFVECKAQSSVGSEPRLSSILDAKEELETLHAAARKIQSRVREFLRIRKRPVRITNTRDTVNLAVGDTWLPSSARRDVTENSSITTTTTTTTADSDGSERSESKGQRQDPLEETMPRNKKRRRRKKRKSRSMSRESTVREEGDATRENQRWKELGSSTEKKLVSEGALRHTGEFHDTLPLPLLDGLLPFEALSRSEIEEKPCRDIRTLTVTALPTVGSIPSIPSIASSAAFEISTRQSPASYRLDPQSNESPDVSSMPRASVFYAVHLSKALESAVEATKTSEKCFCFMHNVVDTDRTNHATRIERATRTIDRQNTTTGSFPEPSPRVTDDPREPLMLSDVSMPLVLVEIPNVTGEETKEILTSFDVKSADSPNANCNTVPSESGALRYRVVNESKEDSSGESSAMEQRKCLKDLETAKRRAADDSSSKRH